MSLVGAPKRARGAPAVTWPLTLENANIHGEGPITFKQKRDLVSYCRENNLDSGALL